MEVYSSGSLYNLARGGAIGAKPARSPGGEIYPADSRGELRVNRPICRAESSNLVTGDAAGKLFEPLLDALPVHPRTERYATSGSRYPVERVSAAAALRQRGETACDPLSLAWP